MKAFGNIENINVILWCRFFLSWIMTRELLVDRFHSKSFYVLCNIIIYRRTLLLFLFYVVFLTIISPSQLDLLFGEHRELYSNMDMQHTVGSA